MNSDYTKAYDFIRSRGHVVDDVVIDGEIHRTYIEGQKRGSLNGYYAFWSYPFVAGFVGNYKTGEYETFSAKSDKELSEEERQQWKQQQQETRRKREADQKKRYREAAKRAQTIWAGCFPATSNHPYALKKCMGVKGLRQGNGSLIVPLFNNREIASLQFITPDGSKKFLSGGRIKGSYFYWGDAKQAGNQIYVAEGISSGWSVHILGDYAPVFCAMNANNLEAVACNVRQHFPKAEIIIAADNDVQSNSSENIGVKYAEKAAHACGGKVSIPQLPNGSKCDWNDLHLMALKGVKHGG